MAKIRITVGTEAFDAVLTEESAPKTVAAILGALPIEAEAMTWGEEIYFEIPVRMGEENAVETVGVGDLGYWPKGACFCLFFGRTPMTRSLEAVKPASAVNPIGRVERPEGLKRHKAGETVRIERAP